MTARTRRIVLSSLIVLTFVAFADVLLVPLVADHRRPCERSLDWVNQHMADLPTAYDQVVAFPESYRHAIFAMSTPATKSALFRENYRRFLATHELSAEKRATIDLTYSLAAPEVYQANSDHNPAFRGAVGGTLQESLRDVPIGR